MLNPYRKLLSILPSRPLQVGTVLSINAGTASIEVPGGGVSQARGTTTVGARVFFRDGTIEGIAPALTDVTVEI